MAWTFEHQRPFLGRSRGLDDWWKCTDDGGAVTSAPREVVTRRSRSSETKFVTKIGVGLLPFISTASVWQKGRPVASDCAAYRRQLTRSPCSQSTTTKRRFRQRAWLAPSASVIALFEERNRMAGRRLKAHSTVDAATRTIGIANKAFKINHLCMSSDFLF